MHESRAPQHPSLRDVLHDVVEDTELTLEDLRADGFPAVVPEAVEALTQGEGEDYEAIIRRVAPNPITREVKLADLRDNSDLSRIADPTARDREPVRRYQRAIKFLEGIS